MVNRLSTTNITVSINKPKTVQSRLEKLDKNFISAADQARSVWIEKKLVTEIVGLLLRLKKKQICWTILLIKLQYLISAAYQIQTTLFPAFREL